VFLSLSLRLAVCLRMFAVLGFPVFSRVANSSDYALNFLLRAWLWSSFITDTLVTLNEELVERGTLRYKQAPGPIGLVDAGRVADPLADETK
jgi:hypothetical protein